MTPAQARLALKDRPNKSRTERANAQFHTPDMFLIDVQDVVIGQHKGIAHVAFDKNNVLYQVSLDFTRYEDETGCFEESAVDELITRSLLEDISAQMVERLGTPVGETGTFPTSRELGSYFSLGRSGKADLQNPLEGKRIWKTDGQLIEEWFFIPCGKVALFVSYHQQPKDEPPALSYGSGQTTLTTAQIAKKTSPSVVVIQGRTDSGDVLGSGFIVSKDGKIVTNLHVIKDMKTASVQTAAGEAFDSLSVLATDERRDLAIVKIAGFDLPVLDLGDSDGIAVGEPVVIVGSPRGLEGTVTAGILSSVRDSGDGFKVLQTDAAVNPGNSGGPLVSNKGQAVGVVSFKLRSAEGLNFAVPINYVRGLLEDLHKPLSLEQMRSGLSAAAPAMTPTTPPRESGPSLRETLDWLRQKIPLGTVQSGRSVEQDALLITLESAVWAFDSCTVSFGSVLNIRTAMYSGQKGTRYTLSLGSLTGSSVTRGEYYTYGNFISGDKDGYRLTLTSKSKDIATTYWVAPAWANQNVPANESRNNLLLVFRDEELARRAGTAFLHVADLCRKNEVF
jgi:S1-C subfamily serine protease